MTARQAVGRLADAVDFITDEGLWAVLISVLLIQGRTMHNENIDLFVVVAQVIALRMGRGNWLRGAAASLGIQFWVMHHGAGPSVSIGFVVVSLAALSRKRAPEPWLRLVAIGLMALGAFTVAYVPWLLHWPRAAIEAVPGRASDPVLEFGLVFVACVLRANIVGAVRREHAAAERADSAAADERARIARELHDVVAHQMSVVVTQAQGAAAIVDTDPRQARRALDTIATTARNGLVEMRRLVQVDRAQPAAVVVEQPQPGLAYEDYARLAGAAEAAGLHDVTFRLDFTDGNVDVSPGVALSAYRLIQEAVTNAAKHSPGATFSVDAVAAGGVLRVEAVNGPPAGPPADIPGSGVGLVGMRERVEFFGGSLETGPTPDGGWSVKATFPTLEALPTDEAG